MEVGSVVSLRDVHSEYLLEQVNLLHEYGDQVLTVFGITAPLSQLAGMCPVDLNDPTKLDAVNNFVVNIANESGMEISSEHVGLFERIIEDNGYERKFTVAPNLDPAPTSPVLKSSNEQQDLFTKPTTSEEFIVHEIVSANTATNNLIDQINLARTARILTSEVTVLEELAVKPNNKATELANNILKPNTLKRPFYIAKENEYSLQTTVVKPADQINDAGLVNAQMPVASNFVEEVEAVSELPLESQEDELLSKPFTYDNISIEDNETTGLDPSHNYYLQELEQQYDHIDPSELLSEDYETNNTEINKWFDLLSSPSEELLNNFANSLLNYLPNIDYLERGGYQDSFNEAFAEYDLSIKPLLDLVAEKIILSEHRDELLLRVTNIVGIVHGINVLSEQGADQLEIDVAIDQFMLYTEELFQELGIDYNEELIKMFVRTLLGPDYFSADFSLESKALNDEGTHEIKFKSNQQIDPLSIDTIKSHHFIGGLALFYTAIIGNLRIAPNLNPAI